MPIYWMFMGLTFLLMIWCAWRYRIVRVDGIRQRQATWAQAGLFFAVIIFFCGLRSGIADTGTYINMFDALTDFSVLESYSDKGFWLLTLFYKNVIAADFHGWLFIIALISGLATMYAFHRYSEDFAMTCFLFISTASFVYMINGMRQYICIALLLAASQWVVEKRFVPYVVLVLLLSTIHLSAIIFIPLFFFMARKPFGYGMWAGIFLTVVIGLNFTWFFSSAGQLLAETQYEGYISYISTEGVGSNVIRLVLAAIPPILALAGWKIVYREAPRIIQMAVNMSVFNMCIYIIATFSSGMVIGRLAAYFDIYNLILLPWLINHIFERRSANLVKGICIVLYIVYFYYQMMVAWDIGYESDILHLFL